ncbi:hypothetical protein MKY89_31195 [Bacillus sp. FSL W7-1294]|uniref:hypothetical protein n=1 Tax=Bacillus TaxID=1386 RepID=UPI00077AA911|nr:hypothetical protein [Bacillus cereus]KXY68808.1 hypothetical protein AT270_10290 [Bacillus cereus]
MKLLVDFHGKYEGKNCKYIVSEFPNNWENSFELNQIVIKTIKAVKEDLLQAKKQGYIITIGLPDSVIGACALLQATRGLLGYTPYVAWSTSSGLEELDIEEIREESRRLLF